MDSRKCLLIEKKCLVFFQLILSLIPFALMSPAMAEEDPEETADPQSPVQFVGPVIER